MVVCSLEDLVWSDCEEDDMTDEDLQIRQKKWSDYVLKYPGKLNRIGYVGKCRHYTEYITTCPDKFNIRVNLKENVITFPDKLNAYIP